MRVGFLRFLGKSWLPSGISLHYYYMRLWRISHQKIRPLHQRVPQPLSLSGGLQQDSFARNWQARFSPQWFLRLFQKESEHARSVYLVAKAIIIPFCTQDKHQYLDCDLKIRKFPYFMPVPAELLTIHERSFKSDIRFDFWIDL